LAQRYETYGTSIKAGPLLDLLAKHESGGNYNAYYGNGNNRKIKFTEMTVGEVLEWQDNYVEVEGSPSSAVGRYQYIRGTLRGMIQGKNIRLDAKFDKNLQDRLALASLEGRGLNKFLNGEMSEAQFILNLAKEWASFPTGQGANPSASYCDGDGLNAASVSVDDVRRIVRSLR
jgi:hypothetical protein